MKYILEIDGVESTRYVYNVWSVNEVYDIAPGATWPAYEKDTRIFETDHLDELTLFLAMLQ